MDAGAAEGRSLRAGVVGLGMIGGGIAISLARRGRVPVVYDVRPEAAELPGDPELLGSPAEVAARSDVVLIAVVSAEQAREVITGESGLLAGAQPGSTVVLLSTVELSIVRELAEVCAASGVAFLDSGVTPGDKAAENGLVTMVGGDAETVEKTRPVLADFAKEVVHCGPLGAGMATKLARNIVTYGCWRAVAEAAGLADAAGVPAETLMQVIITADPNGSTLLQLLRMQRLDEAGAKALLSSVSKTDTELDGPAAQAAAAEVVRGIFPLMDKDLDAAQRLGSALELDLPLVDVTRSQAKATLGAEEK
ncbi:NAD(P)-dependent oxidoreductase [Saccharopolyspora sp. SCSIO 74807]|uniref:NAD(P)-dependent oxidoreductase n=1 Tax=Saccharopolyspora sp. SCSIO 74807 TaxID=3118084 RepID=UPI0030D4E180